VGQRRDDPGRYPLQTLVATLAGLFDMTEETVSALIAGVPDALIRALRKQLGDVRGRLIFVDQLEELVTLGDTQPRSRPSAWCWRAWPRASPACASSPPCAATS
jgi:hypothetical protein